MSVKQTAGRTALGEFAPKFAELNDDVLFGQVWSREDKLSLKERSLITVVALLSQGLTDSSFIIWNRQKQTELQEAKSPKSSRTLPFMQAGPKPGRLFAWQKIFGKRKQTKRTRRLLMKNPCCSRSGSPTMPLPSIL